MPLPLLLLAADWRHHPWRVAVAVLSVALGVALAWGVNRINQSALAEFSAAVRAVNGQSDLELRAATGRMDETHFARAAVQPGVRLASPVLEAQLQIVAADGRRHGLRLLGVDALVVPQLAPALVPRLTDGEDRLTLFAPGVAFINPAARALLPDGADRLAVRVGLQERPLRLGGTVTAGGGPLAVMDIGAAQDWLGAAGQISRIDLRLAPGADADAVARALAAPGVVITRPGDDAQRVSNLSRAYRVNLTVLALVALFTGAFLVHAVLALGVAQRQQPLALLGVLGMTAGRRGALVLAEAAAIGLLGSAIGLLLGTLLAALALRLLGGDLGGGYFPGVSPRLHWSTGGALVHGLLGLGAALAGALAPVWRVRRLPLAQALKGLDVIAATVPRGHGPDRVVVHAAARRWRPVALLAMGGLLALLPPVAGLPLAAYASVGLLLVGGVLALPPLLAVGLRRLAPAATRHALALLAVERARRRPELALSTVGGIVAALALAVALTVMVASFRDSVSRWLDVVLPANLYLRAAGPGGGDGTAFPEPFVRALAAVPGIERVGLLRSQPLLLDAARPPVTLIVRDLGADPAATLPLVGALLPVPAGAVAVYISEPMAGLHGLRPGQNLPAPAAALAAAAAASGAAPPTPRFFIAAVWRDYGRQNGALVLARSDWLRLGGDARASDAALWLAPAADAAQVQAAVRRLASGQGLDPTALEFASAASIRATSLRIFDRSFAVTVWLQAVAVAIGLVGVAAGTAAQVLARRREFGLLAHLGLTRRQVLTLVAAESAVVGTAAAVAGLMLGLAVAVVLVHGVNPQSFHWTMELTLPAGRLALLTTATVAATATAALLAGRAAASVQAVRAVREDW